MTMARKVQWYNQHGAAYGDPLRINNKILYAPAVQLVGTQVLK